MTYAKYLNEDVALVVSSTGKQVENIAAMVNQVNLNKDVIKSYLADFESALKANGKDDNTVKALKSARKAILEFSCGLRKQQLDNPELWSKGEGKKMVKEFAKQAGSINALAKQCREACADEQEAPAWILEEKLAKLIEKAYEEGYNNEEIHKAIQLITTPEAVAEAA